MARSTGPVLAIGAITLANKVVVNEQPMDWRIPIATGLAAGLLSFAEKAWADGAVALAYLGLVTVMFVRIDPSVPTPAESLNKWINQR